MNVVLLFSVMVVVMGQVEQGCGPLQNFWYNSKKLILSPIYENLNHLLVPSPIHAPPPARKCTPCEHYDPKLTFTQRCPLLGIEGGMDVIAVMARVSFGVDITFVPILPVSMRLLDAMYLFDHCVSLVPRKDVEQGLLTGRECFVATELMHCSIYNLYWVLPWTLAIAGVLLGMSILTVMMGICLLAAFQ